MAEESNEQGLQSGSISTAEVTVMGIAGAAPVMCIGGTIGVMLEICGTGTALAVVIATGLCIVFGLCYSYLARDYNCCGGSYAYITNVFGTKSGLWSAFVYYGVTLTVSGGPAYIFSSYLHSLTGFPAWIGFFIFAAIVFGVSWFGAALSTKATAVVFVVEMVLMVIPAVQIIGMNPNEFTVGGAMYNAFVPGNGINGLFAAAAVWIMAFVGFEAASFMGEEMKDGWKGVRISVPLSALGVGIVYVISFWLWTASMSPDQMAQLAASGDPLAAYCKMFSYAGGETMICISVMLAALACSLALCPMMSRFMYDQGRTGLLPKATTKLNKHQTPYVTTIIYMVMAFFSCMYGLYAYAGPFEGAADLFSICGINALSTYAFIAIACVKERWKESGANALIIGKILPIVSVLVAFYSIFFASGTKYVIVTIAWFALSLVLAIALSKRVDKDALAS